MAASPCALLGGREGAAGQANAERRAIDGRRCGGDRAAMRAGDLLSDEEPEPEPMRARWMDLSTLAERIEDERERVRWNGFASIGDVDDHVDLSAVDPQCDRGSGLAVLDG